MRGRSLVKESSGQSICAFCAHRLGQARKPSHLQRRFLHSSRSVLDSERELDVTNVDRDGKFPQVSWGRPNGNTPRPAMAWGRPSQSLGATSGPTGDRWLEDKIPNVKDDLLPHERRARDLILERQKPPKEEPLPQKIIPPSQLTRAGRPMPWSEEEKERLACQKEEKERFAAQRLDNFRTRDNYRDRGFSLRYHGGRASSTPTNYQHIEAVRQGISGPRITRSQIIRNDEGSSSTFSAGHGGVKDERGWGQLRRRENAAREEWQPRRDDRFSEGRALREEQARLGRYTPLGTRPLVEYSRDQNTQQWASSGKKDYNGELQSGRAASNFGLSDASRQAPRRSLASASDYADVVASYQTSDTYPPDSSTQSPDVQEDRWKSSSVEDPEPTEENGRPKKARKRRGGEAQDTEVLGRGKERDKVKRRQQFVRTPEEESEALRLAEEKLARQMEKAAKKAAQSAAPIPIFLPAFITVANLAVALGVKYEEVADKMEELGFEEFNHDYILDSDNSAMVAMEYNFDPIVDRGEGEDLKPRAPPADPSLLPPRPPVVTIMGHVDHGKTTLLDWLRKSSVAATEHGGITQHIGAFSVPMPSGKVITFLDTPGHAAFLSMRQRGANVTDIVILVVAADDSVKPQTIEAINHAKAANVPMIVAINKIDKEDVDIERVKSDLARNGVEIEDFGGDTQVVLVSGKTGQGMGDLEETAVALSEILDMRAEPDGPVEGWVLEASIKAVGKVATVLVRRGTIRPGDFIVAGNTWGRVRVLRNEAGVEIDEAGPGMPVEVDGWREQPLAGDEVLQAPDEAKAKSVVDYRLEKEERNKLAEDMVAINIHRKEDQARHKLEKAAAEAAKIAKRAGEAIVKAEKLEKASGPKQVYLIVKGDVSGSVEAVLGSLANVGNKEVEPHILRSGVGQVSEFDIEHAAAAKGHVINFNTPIEPHIARLAQEFKVRIIDHKIIYALVDDVKAELSKHLPPLIVQKVVGEAEVAQKFEINVKGRAYKPIAGCKVRNGTVSRNSKIRVFRNGEKVYDGTLTSLKNVKKDATEITKGNECGMGFDDWDDFRVGDQIQAYSEKQEKRYL